ncbi:MAG: hydrogenase maturation protease [Halococcoides sp.]
MRRGAIGLGNGLRGDDAIGPRLIEAVRDRRDWPCRTVRSPDLSLVHAVEDFDRVVIVDAARFGGDPGTCRVLDPEAVADLETVGTHDADLVGTLQVADRLDCRPETVRIFAVQAARFDGEGVSDAVADRVEMLADALVRTVETL